MDETLRVKIVADTTQATSSMKTLNKETQGLGQGTNAASAAVDKLDKALNSVGFRSIRLKAVADAFKDIKNSAKTNLGQVSQYIDKIGTGFSKLRNTRLFIGSNVDISDSLKKSHMYMSQMEKKAPEAARKINDVFRAVNEAKKATNDSDEVLNVSGLRKVREAVEGLANSRNKYVNKTLNEYDFEQLKSGLLSASKAAASGAKQEYKEALQGISNSLHKATEKNTLTYQLDTFKNKAKTVISDVTDLAKKGIAKIGNAIASLGKGLLVGGLLTGLLAAIAAIKNAFNVSQLGDNIDKTSQKVGMSTNAFQKWGYVLERCGLEASQLQTAMRGLTRNSMNGNAEYFKQLGIDPNGLSQQQLFDKTVKALQNISDSTQRARIAYKLFGQSSAELAPLLAISNAEVQRLTYQYDLLGATMSGKVVRASVDLQDAITDMKAAFQGLKNTLAQYIIPLITKLVIRLTVFIAKVNMVLKALFGVDVEYAAVEESSVNVTKQAEKTNTAVKKLKTLISGFDELNIFPSKDNGAELSGLLDDLADYGSDVAPVIGNILPPEAIAELENFRDNILPGILEKIEKWKEAWEKIKEAYNDNDFAGILRTLGETADIPFLTSLADGIDWVIGKVQELEHWLGDVDLFGWEIPDSFQEFLGLTEDWHIDWDNFLGLDFDFENSPIGRFVTWWKETALPWLNKNPFEGTWWAGDETTIGLKEMLGIDKIEGWNIWKKEWWQNLFKKGPQEGSSAGVTSLTGDLEKRIKDTWNNIKTWWNTNVAPKFTKSWWQGKFQTAAIGLGNAGIVTKAIEVWASVTKWWNTNVKPKFTAEYWKTKFESIKTGLGNSSIITKVKGVWTEVQNWWFGKIQPKFTWTYWRDHFNKIKDGLGYASILTGIQDKWKAITSWWSTSVAPKFTWTYWRDKFNVIKTGLANVDLGTAAKNIINKMIEKFEAGINNIIDKINNSGIADALRKVGIGISLSRVYIPRLAKGGIIDQPTVAQLGEYPGASSNPEIVTPENKLTQIFENSNNDIVDVLIQGFRQIVEAIEEKDTSVQIGDTVIAKSAARGNKQYRLQTGQSLF